MVNMSDNSKTATRRERPMSPHLSVYKPQITSFASILHRVTGVFLVLGTAFLVWWLYALAGGESAYNAFAEITSNVIVKLLIMSWAGSLIFHLLAGVRHIFWDFGVGYDLDVAKRNGWIILVLTVIAEVYIGLKIFDFL
jgi:succinate dehydrogenase / fumarate reductase cytochrome b subunit